LPGANTLAYLAMPSVMKKEVYNITWDRPLFCLDPLRIQVNYKVLRLSTTTTKKIENKIEN
jgi:hypothetical protein